MNDSDQGMQDQRKNASMEDSTAMTIEFLRARLLSERSVSRTAKQRADELSKRVAELEEQLKTVSLQRKKAEKATADVLAILESQEMSEFSEDYDSSSDQETIHESGEGANSGKEEESSVNSKVRRNESGDFSGSEHESCRVSGGRLSWKGGKGTSPSAEGHKGSSMRRQTSLTSTCSSSRHHTGKSCRQIRHRESRSVAGQESKNGSTKVDAQENGVATSSKGLMSLPNGGPDCLQSGSQAHEENVSANLDIQRSNTNGSPDLSGYGRGKDMERALEHQAQLIGRYQEMEKAQKEWEEKFRENNNSTPDSCDPGNYSDITEEREEFKAQAHSHARTVTTKISQAQVVKPELSKTSPVGFEQPVDTNTRYLHDQRENNNLAHTSQSQEFEFPMEKGRQRQDNPENFNNNSPSQGSDRHARYPGSHEAETSGGRNNLYALVPHQEPEGLGGVLEALKHARLSLQQKMSTNGLPIVDRAVAVVESKPSAPATKAMDRGDIPVGCAGLFRLPTDYPIEAQTQAKTITAGSHLSSSNYYPDARSSYMDSRSVVSADDRFLTRGYMDMRSGVHATQTQRPYLDPRLDVGLPPTSRFTYSLYPDPMVQMSANSGSSRHVPGSMRFGMPPEDHFLSYDDQFRPPSLHRR